MKTLTATAQTSATSQGINRFLDKQIVHFDKNRFGLMAMMLTAQSCIGGIAAMFILENGMNVFELSIVAMATMGANAVMIAQASPRSCLIWFYVTSLINAFFIVYNLF